MPNQVQIEPFGRLDVPPLTLRSLTAHYTSVEWGRLIRTWKITMYETLPGTDEPVEQEGRTAQPSADGELSYTLSASSWHWNSGSLPNSWID